MLVIRPLRPVFLTLLVGVEACIEVGRWAVPALALGIVLGRMIVPARTHGGTCHVAWNSMLAGYPEK